MSVSTPSRQRHRATGNTYATATGCFANRITQRRRLNTVRLWLKFLTEIDENTTQVPPELLATPETSKALKTVEESAMTKDELLAYEDFWDKLGAERLLFIDSNKLSHERGLAEGRAEGLAEGRAEGLAEGKTAIAKNLLNMGMATADVAKATGLNPEEIEKLRK